ncbi:hypothetical protein EDB89DRAFT_2078931 [Lactarius sanguifluus]|nr:hypothetical protein EDB89DRAFT_2078931 [Lactarius sanguifluus]
MQATLITTTAATSTTPPTLSLQPQIALPRFGFLSFHGNSTNLASPPPHVFGLCGAGQSSEGDGMRLQLRATEPHFDAKIVWTPLNLHATDRG